MKLAIKTERLYAIKFFVVIYERERYSFEELSFLIAVLIIIVFSK